MALLMMRPASFAFNAETAASNVYQSEGSEDTETAALAEFDAAVAALRAAGVRVIVAQDTASPAKPDAVFVNNWVSFHPGDDPGSSTVVLYPMEACVRRLEVRSEIVDELVEDHGLLPPTVRDWSSHADQGVFLEGTGSLVLCPVSRTAWACLSTRTDASLAGEWAVALGYELVTFTAADRGVPVYHTNVVMSVGRSYAVCCLEAVADAAERDAVRASLEARGKRVVAISLEQMRAFAGNVFECPLDGSEETVLLMSASARAAFTDAQIAVLADCVGGFVVVDIGVIEKVGGGSARCMVAGIPASCFLSSPPPTLVAPQ